MPQSVFDRILEFLDQNKVSYTWFEHPPVHTSQEAAAIRGTKMAQGAKALVMLADKKPIMIVVPGDRRADLKQFKLQFKFKDVAMATPEQVFELTGVQIGAVPPTGNLFGLPLYVDSHLGENETIAFNAGDHAKSVEMKYVDYVQVAHPILGEFSLKLN